MTLLDRIPGAALAIALMAVIVWASNAPLPANPSSDGLLRLAWSARPERIENCRQQSSEELARLPAHMRQPVVCEGATAEYRLTVVSGGQVVAESLVRPGGLRQDRSLYVFHEVPLAPGEADIEVRFDRLGPDTPSVASQVPRVEAADTTRRQPRGEAVPAHLSLRQRLNIQPREVVLVTYSPDQRALVMVRR